MSYLAKYLSVFGDARLRCIEHIPMDDAGGPYLRHVELLEIGMEMSDISENFTHPCWCGAELIYADDIKGNEVWLHKRIQ